MIVRSYAKINLGLRILGKRPDGYHDLLTVFHHIDLFDTLTFTATAAGASMECNRADLACDDSNLCIRAAKAILALGASGGVHIALDKRIPAGAGLGGGSSNAAAVLRALPPLLGFDVSETTLHTIATNLGSDVPFFLQDDSAVATGRGEILDPLPLALPWWIVTVTPDTHVSTAWAYGSLQLADKPTAIDLATLLLNSGSDRALLSEALVNDFEPTVMTRYPEIAALRDALLDAGAIAALMSGSGSSVFGLFCDEVSAASALGRFQPPMTTSLTAPDFFPVFHCPKL